MTRFSGSSDYLSFMNFFCYQSLKQYVMVMVLIIYLLLFPFSTYLITMAQEEGTPIGELLGGGTTDSFNAKGLIATYEGNGTERFIIAGAWHLKVNKGLVGDFEVNATQARLDGSLYHGHQLFNFTQRNNTSVELNLTGLTPVHGQLDISGNGTLLERGVRTDIVLINSTILQIILGRATESPIHGIVTVLNSPRGNFSCIEVYTC
jgi:hypothetical protein